MLRWVKEAGIRIADQIFPFFPRGNLVGVRPVLNVQNAVVPHSLVNRHQTVISLRNVFFTHWMRNVSKVARAKYNPIHCVMANKRNPTPLFLAFIGFTYVGIKENKNESSQNKEEGLTNWLQKNLQSTAKEIPKEPVNHVGKKLKDYKIGERLGQPSSNSAVYAAKVDNREYALKMLFNFYANSQSSSLRNAFAKEIAVLNGWNIFGSEDHPSSYVRLPCHFNTMEIVWHFADNTPVLPDAVDSYPAALPSSVCERGYGRNRTMFLVMPRFSGTLADYIASQTGELNTRKSLALFAQLLEGLVHINKNGVAHRDLKGDNILVNDQLDVNQLPHLIITDFGCCLAERSLGLILPYETGETSKGGNIELMAPEVENARAGRGQKIDYRKSDEWAAGALAYEMFGQKHPFQDQNISKSGYESHNLPDIERAPKAVQRLVKELLQRHPNDRPELSLAATICQLLLWAPELLLTWKDEKMLDNVIKWYLQEVFSLILDLWRYKHREDIPVDKQILLTFLSRTSVQEIMDALKWLRSL